MLINEIVSNTVYEFLLENNIISEAWYHGTPDMKGIEKEGGFVNRQQSVEYVEDPAKYHEIQKALSAAHSKDEDEYFRILDTVGDLKKTYTYNKPLFLSNKHSIANTYADTQRAFDYQNAEEKVYEVEVECNKIATIIATGDRFRFISIDKVKKGFIDSGIPEEQIDRLIQMFNFYVSNNKGIKTDVVAAIGNWLEFDCIDVKGVLDAYHGGSIQSTVRMVLDPTKARIKKIISNSR